MSKPNAFTPPTRNGIELGCTYLVTVGKADAPVKITEFPTAGGIVGVDQRTGKRVEITLASVSRRFHGMISRGTL